MSNSARRSTLAVCAAAAVVFAAATPRPPIESVLDALEQVRHFQSTAISPDGRRVAYVEKIRARDGREVLSAVDMVEMGSSAAARRFTAGKDARAHRELNPAWSPDGKRLAFLSDAAREKQLQLYVAPLLGGAAHRLTLLVGQLADPKWSPDGRSIAFLFVEGSTQEPGALVAYRPDAGVVAEKVEEQRIAVVDATSGRLRQVSPANLYVYDYDWAPDGKTFAAEAVEGSGTNNYWTAELYSIRADTGEARPIWKPPLQIACPRFSPDGRSIALIHGLMSDEGSTGGDVYLVSSDGAEAKNLTPGMKASATDLRWRSPREILFTEHVDGGSGVAALDPETGKVTTLWSGAEAASEFSVSRNGDASAMVRQSFRDPPEVWAGPNASPKQITRENARAASFWGEGKSLHWQSDGERVQGWLLAPKGVDPNSRYPMVVAVHGGPSSVASASWPARWNAVLPSQGYFVLLPNPRGSYGQGEKFTQGNVKDFGHGDLRDILRGVDEAVKNAPIDPERVGIAGWSYGGYMTMWAVTRTNRFRAAVAGAGIANWQSYYGQNRIDQWMLPFFGASVYEDPAVYAKSSPITYIKNVKTPTLVLHGDRDSEVPTPQGYEFWHALKTLGVPTELVIYSDEGHAIEKRADQRDIERRLVAWFDRYLKAGGEPLKPAAEHR
jgi:dipeptidyl aminopeptidase/acylaminoacyl peptidase